MCTQLASFENEHLAMSTIIVWLLNIAELNVKFKNKFATNINNRLLKHNGGYICHQNTLKLLHFLTVYIYVFLIILRKIILFP